jgi:hypothetical protein
MKAKLLLKKRPLVSLTFSVILCFSMFVGISAIPLANLANSIIPQIFPGTDANTFFSGKPDTGTDAVDPLANINDNLRSWIRTGVAPDNIRSKDSAVCVLMGALREVDLYAVNEHMDILNVYGYPGGYLIQGWVASPKDLILVNEMEYTGTIIGDQALEYDDITGEVSPNMFTVDTIIENDVLSAEYPSIDGTDVAIAIADTGVDFGHSNLADTVHRNSSGYVTSYDPSGMGFAITSYSLAPIGGVLLPTYNISCYASYGLGYMPTSFGSYGIELYEFIVDGSLSKSGFFRFGFDVQVAEGFTSSSPRMFFFFILVDENTPFVYDTMYIDWETSWAITADYNGFTNGPAADWDFTNNDAHRWGDGTEVLAVDFDGDGFNDYSMGCLANSIDLYGYMGGDAVVYSGIESHGFGVAIMKDEGYGGSSGHGTLCAGAAAGRPVQPFDVYNNGTAYYLPGVATGAEIMALKALNYGDVLGSWFWASGYRPATAGPAWWYEWDHCEYWGWDYTNQAQVVSNSWGFVAYYIYAAGYNFQWGNDFYSYTIDFLSTGGLVDPYYNATGWTEWPDGTIQPGPLFVVSSGNAGPGYGTGGAPNAETALMVGASTSAAYAQPTYNNDSSLGAQPYDQIADFSSNGPNPQALPKPDVVAPGAYHFGYTTVSVGMGQGNNTWEAWGGTSLAAPITAGVAALAFQAAGGPPGEYIGMIKSAVMAGCDDLNQPALRQGAGRVNAYRTVNIAFGNDTTDGVNDYLPVFMSNYTFANYAIAHDVTTWSRAWYMQMYYGMYSGTPYYGDSYYHPGVSGFSGAPNATWFSGSFTTHSIKAGDSKVIQAYSGTASLPLTGIDAEWYTLLNESSTTFTSTSVYTTYPLFADGNFDKDFMTQFMNDADYAIIHVSYGADDFEDLYALTGNANYVFLHDWNDTNENGVIDYQSQTSVGEIRRVMYDYSASNVHQIHVGNPGDQWNGNMNATLYYHDVGNEVFLWRNLELTVTIRLYERVDWTWFSFTQHGPNLWNITCTVPGGTAPGIYDGFIKATEVGVDSYYPITVRVDGEVAPGDSLSWGGTDGHPFDQGAITGGLDYNGRYASGEWRWYIIDVTDIDVGSNFTTWIMTNVTWTDPDTCIDVSVGMSGYGNNIWLGGAVESTMNYIDGGHWDGTPTWERQNVLLTDFTWDAYTSATVRGWFIVALHVSSIGGSYVPENFTVTVTPVNNVTQLGFTDLPGPTGTVNCTSAAGVAQNTIVTDDSIWTGPHVIFNGTFDAWSLDGFPTLEIRETDLQVLISDQLELHATFVEANASPDSSASGPYDYAYNWEGIAAGMLLTIDLEVLGGDPGPPSAPHDCELFLLSPSGVLLGASTNAGSVESIVLTAPESGTYVIGVDYWGIDAGSNYVWCGYDLPFVVYASAAAIIPHPQAGLTAGFDTHSLGLNTAIDLKLKAWTGTSLDYGITMDIDITNVTLTNFFAPTVTVTSPNGGEEFEEGPITITWTASDLNLDETLGFTVEVSNDSGLTWKLVVFGTTLETASWDSSSSFYGLPAGDQFMVRVNCTDGMYTVSDTSNAVFTIKAGPAEVYVPYELYIVIATAVIVILILVITCLLKRRQMAAK